MKIFNRIDLVPAEDEKSLEELKVRAVKCGLEIRDVLDVVHNEVHYKELLYRGNRWQYFKYWGIALLKGEVEFKALLDYFKLMFM